LFPANHAVAAVLDDEHNEIQAKPDGGLQILRVHHEPAIAADGHDAPIWIKKCRDHGRSQTGAHRGQRVVEQDRVGDVGAIIPGEPDLVHAIVQANDAVIGHHLPDIGDQTLGCQGVARIVSALGNMLEDLRSDLLEVNRVVRKFPVQLAGQSGHAVCNVADHLDLRKIDLVDVGHVEINMHDLWSSRAHDERWFLRGVVADRDDQIRAFDRQMDVVAFRQRRRADKQFGIAVDRAFSHLRIEKRNL